MNNVSLIGRLTRDPELLTTNSGVNIGKFSLAVDRKFVRQGEERQADFLNIIAFGKTAEFASNYFFKGQQVGVVGRIQTGSYEDKNGNRRYTTEIVAESLYFADSKRDNSGGGGGQQTSQMPADEFFGDDELDDVPF